MSQKYIARTSNAKFILTHFEKIWMRLRNLPSLGDPLITENHKTAVLMVSPAGISKDVGPAML